MNHSASLTIDGWHIEPDRFCISRDGDERKLEPRSMELLLYLVDRPSEVVSRQQIERDVWHGRIVGYDAISGAIAKIRKAFDDDRKNPRIIETIPKSGYRLIATPETTYSPPPIVTGKQTKSRARLTPVWVMAVTAITLLLAIGFYLYQANQNSLDTKPSSSPDSLEITQPSLAVLPFRSLSNDPEQQFYSDGLTDDLITDLTNIGGINVAPRHASITYGSEQHTPREVAEALNVRFVIRGSVRRSFQDIRVNLQMIDTESNEEVWTRRFDDNIQNVFKLQDQIIREIIANIGLETESQHYPGRRTTNLEAYDYFLRAEHRRLNDSGLNRDAEAIQLYRRAIELDPAYVTAYTGLAREALTNWQLDANQIMPAAVSKKLVYESAGQALRLNPNNAEALAILGLLQSISGVHEAGLESVERAITLDGSNPQLHLDLARALSYAGHHQESLAAIGKAFELNTAPPSIYYVERAKILFFLGRMEEAAKETENTSNIRDFRNFAVFIHGALNRPEARDLAEKRLQVTPWENQQYYATIFAYYRRPQDIELIIDSAANAGIPRFAYGFEPGDVEALDDRTIRQLTHMTLWHGTTHNGGNFFQHFGEGNRVALRSSGISMSGSYHLENNRLCVNFPSVLLDLPDCGHIYRDRSSGIYNWVTVGEIYRFSLDN